jgi:hypothetical protein
VVALRGWQRLLANVDHLVVAADAAGTTAGACGAGDEGVAVARIRSRLEP